MLRKLWNLWPLTTKRAANAAVIRAVGAGMRAVDVERRARIRMVADLRLDLAVALDNNARLRAHLDAADWNAERGWAAADELAEGGDTSPTDWPTSSRSMDGPSRRARGRFGSPRSGRPSGMRPANDARSWPAS
jgi:hypothetical protein